MDGPLVIRFGTSYGLGMLWLYHRMGELPPSQSREDCEELVGEVSLGAG